MLWRALEWGGTASKIWVKTRKIVGSAILLFDCAQVFTRVEGGGSEAPIRRMARWGLQANCHGTSFIKFNFNPRVCFLQLLFTQSYGPSYVKQILSGVKNLNDSIETRHDNFSPV
jgi:hypothetical protein